MTGACDPEQIRRCTAELRDRIPALLDRHDPVVVVAALTEHIGGSLYLTQDARICSPETARAIIERVRQIAFRGATSV
jgi:hypothetical protein